MRGTKIVLTTTVALTLAAVCFGCANGQAGTAGDGNGEAAMADGKKTFVTWQEQYPDQYNSFATYKYKEGEDSVHGHFSLQAKMLAPVKDSGPTSPNIEMTDDGNFLISGMHYEESIGKWVIDEDIYGATERPLSTLECFACKTTRYDDYVAELGGSTATQPVSQEFVDAVNGQIFDCYICHSDDPSEGVSPNLMVFEKLAADTCDDVDPAMAACGQCHNSAAGAEAILSKNGDDWSIFNPWKYGFDADSVFRAADEAGLITADPEMGIRKYRTGHTDFEFVQTSNHASLGLTCASCHMPTTTNEDGTTFTSHNSSGSPLENSDAMAYCLTCHESQGVASEEEMVQLVRNLQSEIGEQNDQTKARLDQLLSDIMAAKEDGSVPEGVIAQASEQYTLAKFYTDWGLHGNGAGTKKAVHNPEEARKMQARANETIDAAYGLMGMEA